MPRPNSTARRSPRRITLPDPILDPEESAKAARLRYVTDTRPGIRRKKKGKGFSYIGVDGKALRDKETLARIRSLVIPPAWTNVWICPIANGHLQATGRDARGRKQSRYHPRWRAVRDETKYERMHLFAQALPAIRERVDHDLALPGLPRERVLATIVSLMESTLIRVGNTEYARENKSFGLTTMRNRHVEVDGSHITFSFQGKSRVHHTIDLEDRRLAKIIRKCSDLPGYELFQYLDSEGNPHTVDSSDVNEYLQSITGQYFTAKDFRTWAGSVLACDLLRTFEPFNSATEAKRNIVQAIKTVAQRLGNTPAVCRKCYVHPAVLEAYLDGKTVSEAKRELDKEIAAHAHTLRNEERTLVDLLQQRLMLEKAS
jgi:DNA topoisomerase-1